MKDLIIRLLTHYAILAIATHRPRIIGITGSQGKSSVRLSIVAALRLAGEGVGTPKKNYNNEIGFPLGVLGLESPGRSGMGWLRVLWRARTVASSRNRAFPKTLVLEYGIDHMGDMERLLRIARPDLAVVTGVSAVHAEGFESIEQLADEKMALARAVDAHGVVILNADDVRVMERMDQVVASVVTYGSRADADVCIEEQRFVTIPDASFLNGERACELSVRVRAFADTFTFCLPNRAGKPVASTLAASVAVLETGKISVESVRDALEQPPEHAGRMRILPGIKGTLILDDTYNASPAAVRAALETLAEFDPQEGARRIAVLGSMAELGRYSEDEHRHVGFVAAEMGVEGLWCVGEAARMMAESAEEAGMPREHIRLFDTAVAAGRALDTFLHPGDIVLVKGAQSMRMERVVKDVMAEPLRAGELLVRQDERWLEL